ncbi:MAG: 4-hydroxyphenylacetate 3-hydroxylase family protein [Dehalococcoidia bacterium]|nr:4-hydroxyphenylacetate 3-hydroxylase family protein [Dehalococcoidia bacterium]
MALKTGQQYIDSLRELKLEVYAFGERIPSVVDSPLIRPHINAAAMTYDMAHSPEFEDLVTTTSHLTGEKISRFTHIHQSTDDLIKKVKMLRAIGQNTGTCFQRCVGFDGLNALYSVTYEMDQKNGSDYHQRFLKFLRYVQANDLMSDGAMTDPKGDRSLPAGKQSDPDQYLHIVERREDGIVVRGAKSHQTGAVNSHEIVVMPTTAFGPEERDYAVAFAVPSDTKGIVYIFGRQSNDTRRLEGCIDQGNEKYGVVGGEALVVFDDVFVPWERVFMCGEIEFAGLLVERFATMHRQNYGGCKTGVSDVIIGATTAVAEYSGTATASHVRDKVVEMVHLAETMYCGSIACSAEGHRLPCGSYYPNPLLANTVKQNATRFIYEICRLSHDIAGGFIATLPSEKDLKHPEIGKYVEKYFAGVEGVPTENRIRMGRLIENMTSGTALVESMHGAGSPQAQRIMILRQANLPQKTRLAKRLAGIKDA